MSRRVVCGVFETEHDVLEATRAARAHGCDIVDVQSPFPVHGLSEAMGLGPSRLTWACFLSGLVALIFATWFQYWSSATSWPLDVGGRPWDSWPAFVPVCFEMAVLCAGIGVFVALCLRARLYPGKVACVLDERVTDDRFVLILALSSAGFDREGAVALLSPYHPLVVEERTLGRPPEAPR